MLQEHWASLTGASCLALPGPLPGSAARSQGEGASQSHLPLQAGAHVRDRLSARLCGKEAGAVSIFFHIRHELCPTDMRSHERNSLPPPLQLLKSRAWGVEVKGTPWTSGSRGSLPQQRPAWGKKQEARTTTSWHGDLGPATNALGLHFFSPSVKWR